MTLLTDKLSKIHRNMALLTAKCMKTRRKIAVLEPRSHDPESRAQPRPQTPDSRSLALPRIRGPLANKLFLSGFIQENRPVGPHLCGGVLGASGGCLGGCLAHARPQTPGSNSRDARPQNPDRLQTPDPTVQVLSPRLQTSSPDPEIAPDLSPGLNMFGVHPCHIFYIKFGQI